MKIILVRHYKTKSNTRELIMGWSDAPPEDDYEEDLFYVGDVLVRSKLNIDTVWSSNLGRAKNTARFLTSLDNISSYNSTDKLNEIDYGSLTEKGKKWAEDNYPKHKLDASFVYPGGESFKQMQARCVKFINKRVKDKNSTCCLLVVHAGVIRGIVCHYMKLPYSKNLKRKIGHRYVGVIDFDSSDSVQYTELGEHSDFVKDDIVKLAS